MNLFVTFGLCAVFASGGGNGGHGDGAPAAKLEIRIKPTAMVRGLDIRIGDFCEILPSGQMALELGQVEFGRAPTQGYARTIGRTELIQAIAGAGYDLANFKFEGASESAVQSVVVDVPPADVLEAARTSLQALLALEGGDVEIETPKAVRRIQAPPGRRSQEIVARVRGGKTSPTMAVVDVEIEVDGEAHKKVPITFKLTRYQRVLKTVGPIRQGTALGPQNLELVREAVSQTSNLLLSDFAAVDGLVAMRDLQGDKRLMLADTAPPAVVHKGEIVTVVMTNGRIKVTARALANHDAPISGRVTLTNIDSKKQLVGIVAAPGLVVLH